MKYFDISLPFHNGMVAWPGDTKFERKENRGTAIVSKLTMSSHTGTHIDAPKHFLFNNHSVDRIGLEKFVGKARVLEIKSKGQITKSKIQKLRIKRGERLLFKTSNSRLLLKKIFTPDYISFSLDAAKYLATKKISLIGTDYYGIEAKSAPGHPVHKTLLRAGIVIVEGLNLTKVRPGIYNMAALPLQIAGGDGAPARVVLWK